jgi:hypothetical protein
MRFRIRKVTVLLPLVVILMGMIGVSPAMAEFGFTPENGFVVSATNQDGTPDLQAGSHPYDFTTTVSVNTVEVKTPGTNEKYPIPAGGDVKDIEVNLPAGFVGDPLATPQCETQIFRQVRGYVDACPADSQVGLAALTLAGHVYYPEVYNLVPPSGTPAMFGFTIFSVPIVLVPHVRTGSDDGVSVKFTSIPESLAITKGTVTLWGVPADHGHDMERGECWGESGVVFGIKGRGEERMCPSSAPARPFLSLPTSCSGPLRFTTRIDSYEEQGVFKEDETSIPGMTGCDKLDFKPSLAVQPEPAQAASPSGLSVEIVVPQTYENPAGLAEANLEDTTVTLPAGVAVNPAAADGLVGCSEEQFGLHDAAEVACPDASKVGQVEVRTPLLEHALVGGVFLAQQGNLAGNGSNPFGSLIALYLTIRDPYSGVLIKLAGEVKPDPVTGQLVTTFLNNPQVPFDSLRLSFFGGPRAALVNPPLCGSYTTSAQMSPWSGGAGASPQSVFQITSGPGGSACVSSLPFIPSLVSGTTSNQAGGFSPFSLTFFRTDGEQNLGRIRVVTPPGLLGSLSTVPLCGEPQAAAGTCGPESMIGHVTVGVGAGSNPFYVTGKVYLTVGYHGAPFGLSFVVPAVAGPYNLGTVVVRAAVNVDPHTVALTVTSEPLPQILQGIPLHIRAVNVTIDRERFIFNPTNCSPLSIQALLSSSLGASDSVSTRFQATNCGALAFKPKFSVSTSGHTSRANGASLDAKVAFPNTGQGTQADIHSFKVDLPKQLPSRLTTLQKACTAATFEANPANCPAASVIGTVRVNTPVLPVQLTGPVYFVSHGGEAFPSLEIVLQGDGVRVDVVASTFISKAGITSSTFKTIPDVPFESFELYLPEGKYSALAANGTLCTSTLAMPTAIVPQNGGAEIHESTPISVTGCPKAKTAKKARKAKAARGNSKRAVVASPTHANGRSN